MSDALPEVFRLTCVHPSCGNVVLAESLQREGCSACGAPVAVMPVAEDRLLRAFAAVRRHFGQVEVTDTGAGVAFLYRKAGSPFERVREEFEAIGYLPFLRKQGDLRLFQAVPRPPRKPILLTRHIVLFALTLFTTIWVGYLNGLEMVDAHAASNPVLVALAYAGALLAIFGSHEMGHFAVARLTGTEASLPYFVPGPPPIGTFGAMISLRTPAPNRDAAVMLGAAGPIVGFLVSIPFLWYGLRHSPVVPLLPGTVEAGMLDRVEPILICLLAPKGLLDPGKHVLFHPVAYAGCVGLLATTLNLLPMGQLDGGHVARSLLGETAHRKFSLVVVGALLILGLRWPQWFLWALIGLLITSQGHPGALDEVRPIRARSWAIALVALAILVLSATPSPLSTTR